jgi:hypothetical protein
MNLVMCSGNAPFEVVAAGSLRCDWFCPGFPTGFLQGFSSIIGAYLGSPTEVYYAKDYLGKAIRSSYTELGDVM